MKTKKFVFTTRKWFGFKRFLIQLASQHRRSFGFRQSSWQPAELVGGMEIYASLHEGRRRNGLPEIQAEKLGLKVKGCISTLGVKLLSQLTSAGL